MDRSRASNNNYISKNSPEDDLSVRSPDNIWKIFAIFEAPNKVLLNGLKKQLNEEKENGDEELPLVLWSFHTTPPIVNKQNSLQINLGK